MLTPSMIVWGVVVPILLSTALAAAAWRLWRRDGEPAGSGGHWGAAVALGVGYVVGAIGLFGAPAFPPVLAEHWIIVAVVVVLAWALVEAFAPVPVWVEHPVRAILLAATFAAVLRPYLSRLGPGAAEVARGVAAIAAMTVAALVVAWSGDCLSRRTPGAAHPLLLTTLATCSAVSILLGGTASVAQLAGVVAAGCGPWIVAGIINRGLTLARGGGFVAVALLGALLAEAWFFAELPVWPIALLALAALAPWIERLPSVARRGPWLRLAAWFVPSVLLAAAAIVVAYKSSPQLY